MHVRFSLLFLAVLASCVSPQESPAIKEDPKPQPLAGCTIVLDPGHGGKDPGAQARDGSWEKKINLDIARVLEGRLKDLGARVVMTRNSDRFLSLDRRADMADEHACDLFVSIHADASSNVDAQGATIYIARSGAHKTSVDTADAVLQAIKKAGIRERGVRRAGFRVLIGHARPSILLECGYLTNRQDAEDLADRTYHSKLADAVASGIVQVLGR